MAGQPCESFATQVCKGRATGRRHEQEALALDMP